MHVVEDVIENVRADFQSDGVDDAVLIELQAVCLLLFLLPLSLLLSPSALWEKKHVHQLNGALPKSLPMENCFAVEPCYCVILWFFQGFGSRKPNGELEL